MNAKQKGLLTPIQVAELLGVSAMTVSRLVKSGELVPAETSGGLRFKRHRFAKADVLALKRKYA